MFLWHDDVRPAPKGWEWVKTNEEALIHLRQQGLVQIISMDHDLGADPAGGIYARGESPNGTGFDLLKQMFEEKINPLGIIIHSMSIRGNDMAKFVGDLGLKVIREIYSEKMYEVLSQQDTKDDLIRWFKL